MRITTLSIVCEILTAVLSEYYVIPSGFDIKLEIFFFLPFIMTTKAYSDIVMYMFLDYGVRWDQ